MKRVYAIQLSNWNPSASLPHAIATVWNYAIADENIKNTFELVDVFWQDETVSEITEQIEYPDILMCSCYIWNWEVTYKAIQYVKKKYPECIVIIGGPEPEYTIKWMQEHPEVDVLVAYYGEATFRNILKSYINGDTNFSTIPGTITKSHNNKDNFVYPVLDEIPSPYLNRFYEQLLLKKKQSILSIRTVYETNRGCPYSCAFCDLGATQYRKVRQFDTKRCIDELEWMVKNNIHVIDVADSNFGLFPRDEELVDKIIEFKEQYGYNGSFMPTWSKTKGKHVLALGKKIIKSGLDTMFNISIQSTNDETLKIVNRTNTFDFDDLTNVIKYFHDDNIDVYTDLIFPMPGDTLTSIKTGLGKLIDLPNTFNKIQMNHLSRLTNTPMNSNRYEKYNIEWVSIRGSSKHYYGEAKDTLAVSTKSMSREDVFESLFYAKCLYQPFYYYGIFRNIILDYNYLGFDSRSHAVTSMIDMASQLHWFKDFKDKIKDHYFSALNYGTHFGHKIDEDIEQYFPEYALAYITYMQNNIHDEVKNFIDKRYHEVLDFDRLSHWNNEVKDITMECKNWNRGVWHFKESRIWSLGNFCKNIFIKGRFYDDWKTEVIEKCQ